MDDEILEGGGGGGNHAYDADVGRGAMQGLAGEVEGRDEGGGPRASAGRRRSKRRRLGHRSAWRSMSYLEATPSSSFRRENGDLSSSQWKYIEEST